MSYEDIKDQMNDLSSPRTPQDDEGRILSVIAEAQPAAELLCLGLGVESKPHAVARPCGRIATHPLDAATPTAKRQANMGPTRRDRRV